MSWFDKVTSRIASELDGSALPQDVRAQLELAAAFLERGDLAEAGSRIEPLLAEHPRSADVLIAAGNLSHARGDLETATTLFGRAVDNAPEAPTAWLRLAQTLAALQRYEPALDAARKTLHFRDRAPSADREPLRAQATLVQGQVALAQGQHERAQRAFEQARTHGVSDQDIAEDLGNALLPQNPALAAPWLLLAARQPNATPALVLQAAVLQTDPNTAAQLLSNAIARSQTPDAPALYPLRARLAKTLAEQGEVKDAQTQLTFIPTNTVLPVSTCADLAYAYAALNRFTEALTWAAHVETIPGATQLSWALGSGQRHVLETFAARIATTLPKVAAQILSAFQSPLDPHALAALIAQAPAHTHATWAATSAPPPPTDSNPATLLQTFLEIVKPLPSSHELLWAATRARTNLDRPLIVAILGEFNAGKSSLVNALIGAPLAPVGVKPTTATINTFRHGMGGAHVFYRNATGRKTRQLSTPQVQPFLSTLNEDDAAQIDTVEVFLTEPHLQQFEWVDTPGLNAPRDAHELITKRFMASADLAIWVLSAQQAAKASELAVLDELFQAHTPVMALLNKVDQLEPNDLTQIHATVEQALTPHVFAILNASLRTDAPACRTEVLLHLEAFSNPRHTELKQRSAMAALRPLIKQALQDALDHAPTDATLASEIEEWAPLDPQAQTLALNSAAVLNTALHQAARSALDELLATDGAPAVDTIIASLLSQLNHALHDTKSAWQNVPTVLIEPFNAIADRFTAHVQGRLEGGLAEKVASNKGAREEQLRCLQQAWPDPERYLWAPWRQKVQAVTTAKSTQLQQRRSQLAAATCVHTARFLDPLTALNQLVQNAWDQVTAALDAEGRARVIVEHARCS